MIGLESWFNNFTHMFWSSQTKETVADIPTPVLEYAIWWTMKCGETAAFIGGCIVHPIYRYYLIKKLTPETTTNNSRKIIRNTCRRLQGRFVLAGFVSGPILSLIYANARDWTDNDVRDRCYEIRRNTDYLVLDRLCSAGFLVGWYWKRFQGGVDGINLAIGYFGFYELFVKKYANPLFKDKLTRDQLYDSIEIAEKDDSALKRFWKKTGYATTPNGTIDISSSKPSS